MIQNIYKCGLFTPNENLNKTCENKHRCVIYYNEFCKRYKEGKEYGKQRGDKMQRIAQEALGIKTGKEKQK